MPTMNIIDKSILSTNVYHFCDTFNSCVIKVGDNTEWWWRLKTLLTYLWVTISKTARNENVYYTSKPICVYNFILYLFWCILSLFVPRTPYYNHITANPSINECLWLFMCCLFIVSIFNQHHVSLWLKFYIFFPYFPLLYVAEMSRAWEFEIYITHVALQEIDMNFKRI